MLTKNIVGCLTLVTISSFLVACGGSSNKTKTTPSSSSAPSVSSSSSTASVTSFAGLKIQAEDYLRYSDASPTNQAGTTYRNDAVDIETTTDTDGGYNIGYIDPEEWLEFTLDVTKEGTFEAEARVASAQDGGSFYLEIDSAVIGKDFVLEKATGGWQKWTSINQSLGVISKGTHSLCVQMKSAPFNLNWINLTSKDGAATLGTKPVGDKSSCIHAVVPPTTTVPTTIKINQVGYQSNAEKVAVVPAVEATSFTVVKAGTETVVYTGELSAVGIWTPALESVKLANFSAVTTEGNYELRVAGVAKSAPFTVAANAYKPLSEALLKSFYFQRASTELLEANAGVYKRAAGHMDDKVKVHESAASATRPAGTIISGSKGWYDAGDYNKYIVNSGVTTHMLMAAYESLPDYFDAQNLNIPESGDAVPDILNEVMWNLEWMLAMQDPNDGGVYFKLTSKSFTGFDMPEKDNTDRYVVKKSTTSALDFAAVMAAASRIYAPYEATYPGVSAKMLAAAKSAYAWAKANPKVYYSNPADIATGEYGDGDASDEFAWAAAELYITTKDDSYYTEMNPTNVTADIPSWQSVKSLAWVSLANNIDNLTAAADKDLIKSRLDGLATILVAKKASSAYGVSMDKSEFVWGSNSVAAGQAFMLLTAYHLDTSKSEYLRAAQATLDYLLGRNATDYSFVTGYGTLTPLHIHHRPSAADDVPGSIPGFLVGGPNPGQEDKSNCGSAPYPSKLPARSYIDDQCSYASNEVAINWNASLVFVTAAIQHYTPTSTPPTVVTNKALKIDVTGAGTADWNVQLHQLLKTGLVSGKAYKLSYKVKTSEPKTLAISVNLGSDNNYKAYPGANTVDATTAWQTKSTTFTAAETDASVNFEINLGMKGLYQIWLDDISLTDEDGTNEQITNGSITSAGDWQLGNNGGGGMGVLTIDTVAP